MDPHGSPSSRRTSSGTPENSDVGANTFTVRVTDFAGEFDEAQFNHQVLKPSDPPEFTVDPLPERMPTEDSPYTGNLAGTASDPDVDDTRVVHPDQWTRMARRRTGRHAFRHTGKRRCGA